MTPSPDLPHVGLVVEGRGDVVAVPLLLRKWLSLRGEHRDLVGKPVPGNGRPNALRPNGLEGKVAVAASRPGCYGVLVILDGEGDPVCRLGPKLLARSLPAALGKTVVVALADPKYEAWLVASAETLGLPALSSESPRDPAAAIAQALSPRGYSKPTWQPRLTSKMDLARAASRSHSLHRTLEMFDRLCRSI